jgi:thiol-disulfide isomerase/thioredoxin
MRGSLLALLAAVALLGGGAGAQTASAPPFDRTAAAEQIAARLKSYQDRREAVRQERREQRERGEPEPPHSGEVSPQYDLLVDVPLADRILASEPADAAALDAIEVILIATAMRPSTKHDWAESPARQRHHDLSRLLLEHHLARPRFAAVAAHLSFADPGEAIRFWGAVHDRSGDHATKALALAWRIDWSREYLGGIGLTPSDNRELVVRMQADARLLRTQYADVPAAVARMERAIAAIGAVPGSRLPTIIGRDLDGAPVSLPDRRAGPSLIRVWASWCPWSRAEQPYLEAFARQHPDIEIIDVSVDEDMAALRTYLRSRSGTWPEYVVPGGEPLQQWGVDGYPTFILIGERGEVLHKSKVLNRSFQERIIAAFHGRRGA